MRCVVSWHMGVVGPPEGLTPVEVARRGRDLMRTGDHATWVVKDLDAHKSYVVDLAAGRIIPPRAAARRRGRRRAAAARRPTTRRR